MTSAKVSTGAMASVFSSRMGHFSRYSSARLVCHADACLSVVLVDLSMPVLDGIGATAAIRDIERKNSSVDARNHSTRILALTGMSSLEDKRRAFEAGVDG
jgi:CheY-like chemotaxis protein